MQQAQLAKPQPRVIDIQCDSEGNFNYSFAVLRVNNGDTIKWTCPNNFAVSFEHSPLETTDFHGTNRAGKFETDGRPVLGNPGVYHYAVAVVVGDKVWINAGCPEIIVKG